MHKVTSTCPNFVLIPKLKLLKRKVDAAFFNLYLNNCHHLQKSVMQICWLYKKLCAYPVGSLFTLLLDLFNHEKQDALSTFRSEAICQSNVNQTNSSVTLVYLNGQAMKCTYFLNNEKNSYMCSIYTC